MPTSLRHLRSQGQGFWYVHAEKETSRFDMKRATDFACEKGKGKFKCGAVETATAALTRGIKAAALWSPNIKSMPTQAVINASKTQAEIFLQIDTRGGMALRSDIKIVCDEAYGILSKGTAPAK